ncbi:MAG: uracil-DNA glycosylase [Caulobacterales bacterium 68-7]|nr:MAG: uracil-DNA glycosylase [Caulobacterales bacterium 68-7]
MSLETVLAEIRACRACAAELPHEPRPVVTVTAQTRLMIAGQAPGRRVHESGVPWDDPSGDRLRQWMGVDRETFYGPAIGVAAMAFCFPGTNPKGGDFPPPPRCADLWRGRLIEALPRMELTLLVGSYAQQWALGDRVKATMTDTVAAWREYLADNVLVLPHPSWRNTAWLKRNPWFEDEVTPYLRQRVAMMLSR